MIYEPIDFFLADNVAQAITYFKAIQLARQKDPSRTLFLDDFKVNRPVQQRILARVDSDDEEDDVDKLIKQRDMMKNSFPASNDKKAQEFFQQLLKQDRGDLFAGARQAAEKATNGQAITETNRLLQYVFGLLTILEAELDWTRDAQEEGADDYPIYPAFLVENSLAIGALNTRIQETIEALNSETHSSAPDKVEEVEGLWDDGFEVAKAPKPPKTKQGKPPAIGDTISGRIANVNKEKRKEKAKAVRIQLETPGTAVSIDTLVIEGNQEEEASVAACPWPGSAKKTNLIYLPDEWKPHKLSDGWKPCTKKEYDVLTPDKRCYKRVTPGLFYWNDSFPEAALDRLVDLGHLTVETRKKLRSFKHNPKHDRPVGLLDDSGKEFDGYQFLPTMNDDAAMLAYFEQKIAASIKSMRSAGVASKIPFVENWSRRIIASTCLLQIDIVERFLSSVMATCKHKEGDEAKKALNGIFRGFLLAICANRKPGETSNEYYNRTKKSREWYLGDAPAAAELWNLYLKTPAGQSKVFRKGGRLASALMSATSNPTVHVAINAASKAIEESSWVAPVTKAFQAAKDATVDLAQTAAARVHRATTGETESENFTPWTRFKRWSVQVTHKISGWVTPTVAGFMGGLIVGGNAIFVSPYSPFGNFARAVRDSAKAVGEIFPLIWCDEDLADVPTWVKVGSTLAAGFCAPPLFVWSTFRQFYYEYKWAFSEPGDPDSPKRDWLKILNPLKYIRGGFRWLKGFWSSPEGL